MNSPPFDDAAPPAGGAGVNGPNDEQNLSQLPVTPPARRNAPPGTSGVAAKRIAAYAAKQRAEVLAVTLGAIVDSGGRRMTPRGRPAAVWVAAAFADAGPEASADAGGANGGAT
jgi:hypothetical protein